MNKVLLATVAAALVFSTTPNYSTTSVVTLSGAIIKASSASVVKKHKRKDCPVCKGKGWYISGDGIKKIDCQYCEPEESEKQISNIIYR
tara:strand:- start:231 stop:497 length:267 start_codon:yes stop_codon:yes gene_type:complete